MNKKSFTENCNNIYFIIIILLILTIGLFVLFSRTENFINTKQFKCKKKNGRGYKKVYETEDSDSI